MSGTLRDDLASLRIERRESYRPTVDTGYQTARSRPRLGGLVPAMIWLLPLGLVAGGGYVAYLQYDKLRPRAEVSVALVQMMTTGEKDKLLSAKGYIMSHNQAMIGAKAPGRVERMFVEEGEKVKKGQVLAILEHNDLKATLESRVATIERTKSELDEALADQDEKDRKLARVTKLQNRAATTEELDQARAASRKAGARVAALRSVVKLMTAMCHECEENIRNMHVVAPFDGTIVAKSAEEGETITPGGMGAASGRGAVATLANLSLLDVETDVAENLLSRIAVGQPAEISVSAVPGKHYKGKLRRIIPMGDRARGTIKVKVRILDPDDRLFPELVATVHFLPDKSIQTSDSDKSSLYVPKPAVIEEGGHSYVWVVDESKAVQKRKVEVVVTQDDLVRVESGLKVGESVVMSPPKTLKEREIVKVAD